MYIYNHLMAVAIPPLIFFLHTHKYFIHTYIFFSIFSTAPALCGFIFSHRQNSWSIIISWYCAMGGPGKNWTPHKRRGPIAAEFSGPGPAAIALPSLIGSKSCIIMFTTGCSRIIVSLPCLVEQRITEFKCTLQRIVKNTLYFNAFLPKSKNTRRLITPN